MIYIFESKPVKISGLTSLFIKFDYRKELVDTVKQCDIAVFDKDNCIWEVPTTDLKKCVKLFSQYDKVKIKLINSEEKENPLINISDDGFKTKPFNYQMEGINFGLNHDKWMLLDAPGLGKTLQAIYLAETLYEQGKIKNCLIISCKNLLKFNWVNEIKKHSKLTGRILGQRVTKSGKIKIGSLAERIADLENNENFFVVTNIETLRDKKIIKPINKIFDMVIVDEGHCCKDSQSQQGSNLLKLTMKFKLLMTGTVLLNSPFDCYVPLKFIEKEKANLTNFKYYYGKFFGHDIVGYKNTEVLKKLIEDNSLRRTKDLLDLPEKTIINETVEMDLQQENFYNNIINGIIEQVDKVHISTSSLLAMITRLRQATACPESLTSEKINSAKIDRCCELAEEIIQNGDSVVIFSTFKDTASTIAERLKFHNPLLVTGDTDCSDADVKFQSSDSTKVFVGTWQKAGTGLTLTKANYMIFIDTPWTWAVYEQAQDRIYRIGTNKKVFIYNLICKDTIDERVNSIVMKKKSIADYVIDDELPEGETLELLKQYITDLANA